MSAAGEARPRGRVHASWARGDERLDARRRAVDETVLKPRSQILWVSRQLVLSRRGM